MISGRSEIRICFRRHAVIAVSILIPLVLCTFGCRGNDKEEETETITLRYSSPFLPSEHPNIQANHALDLVEQKTNGRVHIERFMGGSLGDSLEHLDLVSSGAVDIIHLHVDQFPQQLPLHKLLNTEQLVDSVQAQANITAITQEIPETKAILDAEAKKNNIKILYWHVMGVSGITTGFPARSLEDLKGKKMNVVTSFQRKVFVDFGIIPVNVQIPELYESLSRGVIDTIFMATSAVVPLKWYEVGKTHLVLGDNYAVSQPITLNLDTWNQLPDDIQQAFIEASLETAQWTIEDDKRRLENTYATLRRAGVDIVDLPREESEAFFNALLQKATEDWLKNAKSRGVGDQAAVIQTYWSRMGK